LSVKPEPAVVVASTPALIQRWVAQCTMAARAAQAARGRFALAVPGGSVAERFLPPLAHADIDWSLVDVCFCDERCVPPLSGDSNVSLVEQFLRVPLGDQAPRVHRMMGEDPDPWRAAREYASTLRFL